MIRENDIYNNKEAGIYILHKGCPKIQYVAFLFFKLYVFEIIMNMINVCARLIKTRTRANFPEYCVTRNFAT